MILHVSVSSAIPSNMTHFNDAVCYLLESEGKNPDAIVVWNHLLVFPSLQLQIKLIVNHFIGYRDQLGMLMLYNGLSKLKLTYLRTVLPSFFVVGCIQ